MNSDPNKTCSQCGSELHEWRDVFSTRGKVWCGKCAEQFLPASSARETPGTCLQCGRPNAKGGIVADDDYGRVLACHECCEQTADVYGRARALKRADAAEAQVTALQAENERLREALKSLVSHAVGLESDPLWIVSQQDITAARAALVLQETK